MSIFLATAYAAEIPTEYKNLLESILANIVNPLILLMTAVALIYFLWGVFVFIKGSDDVKNRETGGRHILYGALGLFVMASAYGIMYLILGTIGK